MNGNLTKSERLMQRCLELASKGGRSVAPNPMVGCVIEIHGEIVAEGYHQAYGGPHAEVEALEKLPPDTDLTTATLYVNLEPCSHTGKTPPCAEALLKAGIPRVVVGQRDPNPLVSGRGIQLLKNAGVNVQCQVHQAECVTLNKRFNTAQLRKRPYITLKWAQTSDGFIARDDYSSKWISSEESRTHAHSLRASEQAILVGSITAAYDNPELTVRHTSGIDPLRLVIDRQAKLPHTLKLFSDSRPTWVFSEQSGSERSNVKWIRLNPAGDTATQICSHLFENSIHSLIVEGGATTHQLFLDAGLWDEAFVYVSPTRFESGIQAVSIDEKSRKSESICADTLLHFENSKQKSLLSLLEPNEA